MDVGMSIELQAEKDSNWLRIGHQFNTFDEMEATIRQYETTHFVQFAKLYSRTIDGARRKGVKRYLNSKLKYFEVKYSCIHAGKYQSRSTGVRNTRTTVRQGCEACIQIRVSADGNKLEILHINELHNHEINENIYNRLPRQRKLDDQTQALALTMLQMNANKKEVQCRLMQETGKIIKLKDLHNLVTASRNRNDNSIGQVKGKVGSESANKTKNFYRNLHEVNRDVDELSHWVKLSKTEEELVLGHMEHDVVKMKLRITSDLMCNITVKGFPITYPENSVKEKGLKTVTEQLLEQNLCPGVIDSELQEYSQVFVPNMEHVTELYRREFYLTSDPGQVSSTVRANDCERLISSEKDMCSFCNYTKHLLGLIRIIKLDKKE